MATYFSMITFVLVLIVSVSSRRDAYNEYPQHNMLSIRNENSVNQIEY